MSISPQKYLDLASEYGTPLYVYDADLMRQRYNDLFNFITYPRLKIHYAMKANYNPALLKMLQEAGASLDTVSPGEVLMALRLGFTPDRIIFTANNLTDAEVAEVVQTGVLMNIGSLSRLRKFARDYPGSKVCIRFNPDVVDGDNVNTMTGGDLTKFGILLEDAAEASRIAGEGKLTVTGLHSHTGSGLQHAESVYQSMKNMMEIARPELFPDLEFMDFGGGFKVPYHPDEKKIDYMAMGAEITRLFQEFCTVYGRVLGLCFEPGKYLSAECGSLLVTVNTLKHNRSRTIAGCNSGFPQLIRPVFYGAYHQIFNLSNPDGKPALYDVCGNICETGDRFAEQRELPEIREGDVLRIANAGAYCYSMGGIYNLRAMPPEVVACNGKYTLIRKGMTNSELVDSVLAGTEF